jgi:hypothetical protein
MFLKTVLVGANTDITVSISFNCWHCRVQQFSKLINNISCQKGLGNKLSLFSSDSLKSSPFTRQYTKKPSDGDDEFSMKNMMQMMMLQQQSKREDRLQQMEEMRANEKARMEENRASGKNNNSL